MFEDKILGTYNNPQQAVEALIGGHTALSSFYASSSLGIPEDIKNWKKRGLQT
ncbi:MAG: hypothetical protein MRK02_10960 [Candidatus Scalindua sp.]|nr:hypothetical protein [Candidatus Scalindua sp.]